MPVRRVGPLGGLGRRRGCWRRGTRRVRGRRATCGRPRFVDDCRYVSERGQPRVEPRLQRRERRGRHVGSELVVHRRHGERARRKRRDSEGGLQLHRCQLPKIAREGDGAVVPHEHRVEVERQRPRRRVVRRLVQHDAARRHVEEHRQLLQEQRARVDNERGVEPKVRERRECRWRRSRRRGQRDRCRRVRSRSRRVRGDCGGVRSRGCRVGRRGSCGQGRGGRRHTGHWSRGGLQRRPPELQDPKRHPLVRWNRREGACGRDAPVAGEVERHLDRPRRRGRRGRCGGLRRRWRRRRRHRGRPPRGRCLRHGLRR
mmetsp:Transcript_29531/g.91237  ORF Transcript_29531/g.91237 Transcript_29531/m.91237 type:complete len:315 (+) Transcript_29531:144-1088(+)